MHITAFAPEFPYPPNRGGSADVWRRIVALHCMFLLRRSPWRTLRQLAQAVRVRGRLAWHVRPRLPDLLALHHRRAAS